MVLGGAVILAGLSLATGLVSQQGIRSMTQNWKWPRKPANTPRPGPAKPSTSS
jgi:hypothetical protein